jgi:hypothetical protein
MTCTRCKHSLEPLRRILYTDGTEHLLSRCPIHGEASVRRTPASIAVFSAVPLVDSGPRRRYLESIEVQTPSALWWLDVAEKDGHAS